MILLRYVRCGLFFAAAVLAWSFSRSLLWAPLLLLALFFFAIDVRSVDKNPRTTLDMEAERAEQPLGRLGWHWVDGAKSYGLFVRLLKHTVFIDLREDLQFEERKEHANLLFEGRQKLQESLARFLEENPNFRDKQPTYVGLHRSVVDECEVFWEPEGHSLLKGFSFVRSNTDS